MPDSNVQPLRTSEVDDGTHPPILTRLITPPPNLSNDEIYALERSTHLVLLAKNLFKLSAQMARVLLDKQGPVENWCGAVFDADDSTPEVIVNVAPRDVTIESLGDGPWGSETRERLKLPFLPDRLDVIVEAKLMLVLASVELFPAFPVTRAQAESMNLPAQLLFAKGEAFASVGEVVPDDAALLEVIEAHNELVEDSMEELFTEAVKTMRKHDLRACAGVVLSLGPEGHAVTVVPREMAKRLLAHEPFLARKLDRPAREFTMSTSGDERFEFPVVVWAKGHVSVQSRDAPKKANDIARELRE
jgi:hypothetical protein